MTAVQTCPISQMDRRLLTWLDQKRIGEQIGTVHSVFDKVVNFITDDRTTLFSLAKDEVIQSPGMMKTCHGSDFSDMRRTLKRGDPVWLAGNGCLRINDRQWAFSHTEIWERDIASLSQTRPEIASSALTRINAFILENGARNGIYSAWKSFNHPDWHVPEATRKNIYFSPFLDGLKQLAHEIEQQRLEAFMGKFAGLGIGLTPSGDDFLTGLLATWQYFDYSLLRDFKTRRPEWLQDIKGRTTDVGYFMLKHCLEGQVNEALLDLLENLNDDPAPQLQQVLAIGSTSGTDMLTGVSFAYQQLLE